MVLHTRGELRTGDASISPAKRCQLKPCSWITFVEEQTVRRAEGPCLSFEETQSLSDQEKRKPSLTIWEESVC